MGVILLIMIWIIIGIILYKRYIKHRGKKLKESLIEQKESLKFIAISTDNDKERIEAFEKIEKCDKAIKNLEKQWY